MLYNCKSTGDYGGFRSIFTERGLRRYRMLQEASTSFFPYAGASAFVFFIEGLMKNLAYLLRGKFLVQGNKQ